MVSGAGDAGGGEVAVASGGGDLCVWKSHAFDAPGLRYFLAA